MNVKGIEKSTWARVITLFLVLINQVSISFFDFRFLPFAEQEIYEGVSTVITVVVAIWTSWKDNDITHNAQDNKEFLRERGLK